MNSLIQTPEFLPVPEEKSAGDLPAAPREWFKFYTPSDCRAYQPPPGHVLVGDCHIVRGGCTVIGGAPGTGKSRAAMALAVAGASGLDWFGLKVHKRFKTAILQAENGRYRLKMELDELNDPALDEFIRVSEPPAFGMAFKSLEFQQALAAWVAEFKPDVLVLDPWNAIAHDDAQRDYREAFESIRAALPKGDDAPAIVIVAHTRKPKGDFRATGRNLLNELAGSHVLGSVARCAFALQPASEEEADDRVVWSCCKNNDGELGSRSAWHRRNGLFAPCPDFDWEGFDKPRGEERAGVTEAHMEQLFANGRRIARSFAVKELMDLTQLKQAACYNALSPSGRFKDHLREEEKLLFWVG